MDFDVISSHQNSLANSPTFYLERVAYRLRLNKICLTTAIAARLMLGIRGYRCELVLGVALDSENAMSAHAWSFRNGRVLTGYETEVNFTPVSYFTCEPFICIRA